MPLSIKDEETERLARALARATGESITTATRKAIEERLRKVANPRAREALLDDLASIRRRWSGMQVLDHRSPDEILGYDEAGLPR